MNEEKNLKELKDRFAEIYKNNIKREGADKLLAWLEKSDFFTAPASTKYHSAYEGGLLEHSIKTYERLKAYFEIEPKSENIIKSDVQESLAICGLLHDLCKTGFYKTEMRNVKTEDGKWVQKPFYTVDDVLPYGHGEKSVYIISGFMKLTRDEAMAINWHMGGFDERVKGGSFALTSAMGKYPLVVLLHMADLSASYLDEELFVKNK